MIGQGDLLLNNLSPICSFCFNFMGGAQKINKELILNMRNIFAGSHTEHQPFFSGSSQRTIHAFQVLTHSFPEYFNNWQR